MKKKIILTAACLVFALFVYLAFAPSSVDPVAYQPPLKPLMTGVLAPNNALQSAELLALEKIDGPEDTAVDAAGIIYAGTRDGRVMRVYPDGKIDTFAETGGRPLGLQFDAGGNLIVCDSWKGLLSIDREGKITVLATEAEGVPFRFTDDLDIGRDGTIYFTDASSKFFQDDYLLDLLEARPNGRFLSYNPSGKEVKVLLGGLYFANGVALSKNEDFVLINETYRYRVRRYWLKGPMAGTSDIFIDNLPGFPDNISSNGRGGFWLALFTVRNDIMDRLHPHPGIKKIMSKLPRFMWPAPAPYGLILALDETGAVSRSLHDPSGETLRIITSAVEHKGYLYIGSLHEKKIGKLRL